MHFVYLLEHPEDDKYYIGCTNDLERRLKQHRSGKIGTTTSRVTNPEKWKIAYAEIFRSQEAAYTREKHLKQYGSAYQKLKERI